MMRAGPVVCTLLLAACGGAVRAADGQPPLAAKVKILSSASTAPSAAMRTPETMLQAERSQPTTTGGKLPQYQLDHRQLTLPTEDELQTPRLRLILALPAGPLLLEAQITIDGQPFHMAREQRIEKMIKELANGDEVASAGVLRRIGRYLQETDGTPSPEEVRWLLTHWVDGPTLLVLNDNFQRFRANQRPAFHVLDRDRDGTVSAEELQRAVESFQECDFNRNDIVEYTELAEAASDPRLKNRVHTGPGNRLFLMPDAASASATYRRLAVHYATKAAAIVPRLDANADGRFDAQELASMRRAEPDLSLAIAFDTEQPGASVISCTALGSAFAAAFSGGSAAGHVITLPLAGALVAFSAVQDAASDQVSLGAVEDGYPMLPRLDPNEDGRFTLRELRGLVERLREIDRNQDGHLTDQEVQPTIRICFGLGPQVHRELAGIRQVRSDPGKPAVAGPEWFARMDRNKDNDLTRGEFPGTDQQFSQLDADGDSLVSAEEANRFDKKSSSSENDSASQELQDEKP